MKIGFALCGSFCTYETVFPVMEALAQKHRVIPIFSFAADSIDSRFGMAADHLARVQYDVQGESTVPADQRRLVGCHNGIPSSLVGDACHRQSPVSLKG